MIATRIRAACSLAASNYPVALLVVFAMLPSMDAALECKYCEVSVDRESRGLC